MPVPTTIADLNQTAALNSPLGTETVGPNLDDYLRAISAFVRQIFDGTPLTLGSVAGTADAITATSSAPFTAYVLGQSFRFVPTATNATNAVTININGIGTRNITKNGNQPLAPGDLVAGVAAFIFNDGTQFQLLTAPNSQIGSDAYLVRGLRGSNNTGSPNNRFDFAADAVTLRSTNGSPSITRFNTGALTADINVAGPTANGRDQAAAFAVSSWLHFYYIWNGTTLATIVSLSAPPAGPTLPTGYTHWAYITSMRTDGSGNLFSMYVRGASVWWNIGNTGTRALSNGTQTVYSNVSLAPYVPPNAVRAIVNTVLSVTHTVAGAGFILSLIPSGSALTGTNQVCGGTTQIANIPLDISNMLEIPIGVSSQIAYKLNVAPNNGGGAFIDVFGYVVPNGGE